MLTAFPEGPGRPLSPGRPRGPWRKRRRRKRAGLGMLMKTCRPTYLPVYTQN